MHLKCFSRSLLLLLCFALSINFLSAQYNYVGSLDHSNGEFVHDAENGSDGGMLLLIQNSTSSSLVSSLDTMGNLVWSKSVSGVYEELMVAADGSIFLMEPDMGSIKLAKLTASGDPIWHQSYPLFFSSSYDFFAEITSGGNIILGGFYFDFLGGVQNKILMVDPANGTPIWNKQVGPDKLERIRATKDGGCLLLFRPFTPPNSPGGKIHRLDSLGNLVWAKELTGVNGALMDLVETTQGDLVIQVDSIGLGPNGDIPVYLLRLDSIGTFQFGFEISDSGNGSVSVVGIFLNSMQATLDNGVVFGGFRQAGDITLLSFPNVFYLGTSISNSFMLECFDPEIPTDAFNPATVVTPIGGPGSQNFGFATNTTETFYPNSEIYIVKKSTLPLSSCDDCILNFSPYQGNSLVTTTAQYTSTSIIPSTLPLQTSVAVGNVTNLCLECVELISGGFFTQGNVGTVSFTSTLVNADSLVWDFGDGNTSTATNPTHGYSTPGTYTACLTGYGLCDTLDTCQVVSVLVGVENAWGKQIQVYPVPADQSLMVKGQLPAGTLLRLMDLRGKVIFQQELLFAASQESINVTALPSGIYWLEIAQDDQRFVKQVEVLR